MTISIEADWAEGFSALELQDVFGTGRLRGDRFQGREIGVAMLGATPECRS
jgi:hypothetical protein